MVIDVGRCDLCGFLKLNFMGWELSLGVGSILITGYFGGAIAAHMLFSLLRENLIRAEEILIGAVRAVILPVRVHCRSLGIGDRTGRTSGRAVRILRRFVHT
ncbi:MAG: hypothetical protein EA377_08020 [Phycisphaerales bacterium]|nr:MAG: hypothetical protein EA377_08020 [Phycisphaerales bacterium]